MSQRNRIVCVAIIAMVSFVMAAPAPVFAAGPPQGKAPQIGVLERAWSWFTSIAYPGGSAPRVLASRWEKEGGAIDPNGQKVPSTILPVLSPCLISHDCGR